MRCVGVALLTLLAAPTLEALDVYRWVDDAGVVHFSQWRPAADTAEVRMLTLEDTDTTSQIDEDLYAVEEQAEIMRELWQEIERKRADRREEEERAAPPPAVVYYPEFFGHAFAPLRHGRFPNRFHPRGRARPAPEPEPEPMRSVPFRPPGGPR